MTPTNSLHSSSSSAVSLNLSLPSHALMNNTRSSTFINPRIQFGPNIKPQNAFFFHCLRSSTISLRVAKESSRTDVSPDERSEADKIVDSMDFGELCNEFECISSPLVESSARQLVRDILELRQGNRAIGTYAVSVRYKDPVRSFTGREKYKRRLWATDALENPTVSVQQMVMLSTSLLNIKWTLKGKPKSPIFFIGGDLIVKVDSKFTLNQISGQVIEHEELWDLSSSSLVSQAYFWASRRLFASFEVLNDFSDFIKDLANRVTTESKNIEMSPDPSGDPTKFFQRDESFQRDLYQIALFLAIVYFVVQYLRTTL
ncbi:alpha/beta-Hydrolases superfamily protein [Striga asiatica]|uniref:Alpha/beta-Hydrolases superfamily protein n=1 Tax=Striga asiatica TaxID=4170 RepID=A0A5A7R3K7_STRAF|nr:alpha/beta-Hydrolases superfamily protein [Striga asiatica]